MQRKRIASALLSGLITLVVCSCSTPDTAPGTGQPEPLGPGEYPKVAVEDPLHPWTAVSEPIVKWDPLQVTVPVRTLHHHDYDVRIEYRYVFFDAQGAPLRLQQSWRYDVLPPGRTQIFLAGTALDDTARDWRLEIRRAR